jgi:hypothetical protein
MVRNYRNKPIVFELRRVWDGDIEYDAKFKTTAFDYRTTETVIKVKGRSKTEHPCAVTIRFGENKKQDRVEID